jgi:hypothetical protein
MLQERAATKPWAKSARSPGVASEMRTCGVAPLARTAGTVRRGAPCRHAFRPATRLARYYEIGSKTISLFPGDQPDPDSRGQAGYGPAWKPWAPLLKHRDRRVEEMNVLLRLLRIPVRCAMRNRIVSGNFPAYAVTPRILRDDGTRLHSRQTRRVCHRHPVVSRIQLHATESMHPPSVPQRSYPDNRTGGLSS